MSLLRPLRYAPPEGGLVELIPDEGAALGEGFIRLTGRAVVTQFTCQFQKGGYLRFYAGIDPAWPEAEVRNLRDIQAAGRYFANELGTELVMELY